LTGVDELPAARLRALLVDARAARAQQIAQMGDARRVATLTAFAAIGELRAQDQTLDHLDVILSEIDDRAAARRKRRARLAGRDRPGRPVAGGRRRARARPNRQRPGSA
jgi:hypothetical protein